MKIWEPILAGRLFYSLFNDVNLSSIVNFLAIPQTLANQVLTSN